VTGSGSVKSVPESLKRLIAWARGTLPFRLVQRYGEDDGGIWATVIAWNGLTAIFPIALALVAISGFILGIVGVGNQIVISEVVQAFPRDANAQQEALAALKTIGDKPLVFALIALAGYLWTASNLFGAIEAAFDAVWHCGRRPFLRQKLMALGMMAIFSVLAVIGVGTAALLPLLRQLPNVPSSVTDLLNFPLQFAVGALAGFLLYLTIYYVVPNRKQRLSRVWPGALFAGIGFELLTLLFPLYIGLNTGINQFGKQFAFLFILLAFFFFLGLITMIGAELNVVLFESVERQPSRPLPGVAPPAPPRGARLRGPRRLVLTLLAAAIGLFAVFRNSGGRR
jgi:membrane protein